MGELAGGAVVVGPVEALGVPVEAALLDVIDRARGHPVALVVGDEDPVLAVHRHAVGAADAAGPGGDRAVRRDPQDPPAVGGRRAAVPPLGVAEADVQPHPPVALAVPREAEGELVVVARHAPVAGDGLDHVAAAVAVRVQELRDLAALDDMDLVVLDVQAEALPEALVEEGQLRGLEVGAEGFLDDPDLAAAGADDEPAVGEKVHASDLEGAAVRGLEVLEGVGVGLAGGEGGALGDEGAADGECDHRVSPSSRARR